MLPYSFCFSNLTTPDAERWLWKNGVLCWADYLRSTRCFFKPSKDAELRLTLTAASAAFFAREPNWVWFFERLSPGERIRVYPHLKERFLFFDVETTGLRSTDRVTTLTTRRGGSLRQYVRGANLPEARKEFDATVILASFNGKRFDVPFLKREDLLDGARLHLDLYVELRARGFRGGLKAAERILGVRRAATRASSGADAARLWLEYEQNGDRSALTDLLKYNAEDVLSLVKIAKLLYTESMNRHPFYPFSRC